MGKKETHTKVSRVMDGQALENVVVLIHTLSSI